MRGFVRAPPIRMVHVAATAGYSVRTLGPDFTVHVGNSLKLAQNMDFNEPRSAKSFGHVTHTYLKTQNLLLPAAIVPIWLETQCRWNENARYTLAAPNPLRNYSRSQPREVVLRTIVLHLRY